MRTASISNRKIIEKEIKSIAYIHMAAHFPVTGTSIKKSAIGPDPPLAKWCAKYQPLDIIGWAALL